MSVQGLAANRIDSLTPVVRARPSGGGRLRLEGLAPMDREAMLAAARIRDKRYRDSHPGQSNARQRLWPWRKAKGAAEQGRRSAREHGVPEGSITKEVMARIHLLPCTYCGVMPGMEADHIVPFRYGGRNDVENLAPSCPRCNQRRGAYVLNAIVGRRTTAEFDLLPHVPAKTHCLRGHPLSGDNLNVVRRGNGQRRRCRACERLWATRSGENRRLRRSA